MPAKKTPVKNSAKAARKPPFPPFSSPFPYTTSKGVVIVDERCKCDALRSEHGNTLAWGHGACPATGCARFTWVAFVEASVVTS